MYKLWQLPCRRRTEKCVRKEKRKRKRKCTTFSLGRRRLDARSTPNKFFSIFFFCSFLLALVSSLFRLKRWWWWWWRIRLRSRCARAQSELTILFIIGCDDWHPSLICFRLRVHLFFLFFFCSSFGRSVACERLKEINRRWHRWWVRSLVSITVSYGFATEQKATVSSGFYFYLRVRIENSIKSESHGIRLDILCVRLQYTQHSFVRVFFSHLSPSLRHLSFVVPFMMWRRLHTESTICIYIIKMWKVQKLVSLSYFVAVSFAHHNSNSQKNWTT